MNLQQTELHLISEAVPEYFDAYRAIKEYERLMTEKARSILLKNCEALQKALGPGIKINKANISPTIGDVKDSDNADVERWIAEAWIAVWADISDHRKKLQFIEIGWDWLDTEDGRTEIYGFSSLHFNSIMDERKVGRLASGLFPMEKIEATGSNQGGLVFWKSLALDLAGNPDCIFGRAEEALQTMTAVWQKLKGLDGVFGIGKA
jgi:hypothetical protein